MSGIKTVVNQLTKYGWLWFFDFAEENSPETFWSFAIDRDDSAEYCLLLFYIEKIMLNEWSKRFCAQFVKWKFFLQTLLQLLQKTSVNSVTLNKIINRFNDCKTDMPTVCKTLQEETREIIFCSRSVFLAVSLNLWSLCRRFNFHSREESPKK